MSPTVTSNKKSQRQAKKVPILSCSALPEFLVVLCQKWYLIRFHRTLCFHGFMKSLLGLMRKPNYENIPQALQFNCDLHKTEAPFACSFIQCPPVLVGWGRMNDHCFVGTCLGAPLSLHHLHSSSSLTGECPTLWDLHPLGTEIQGNP